MKRKAERRFLPASELRIEKRDDGSPAKIAGYAAVFNKLSENLGGFREKIKPGAFKIALKTSDPRALFNHDSNFILGRKSAGTLELKEDGKGLFMEISPPDTQYARDLMVSIERGDITQQSFGFYLADSGDEWKEDKKTGAVTRTINEVEELLDVSPVTYPAYPDTTVALRSLEEFRSETEEIILDEEIPITDGETAWIFKDLEELKRVNEKITELINAETGEEETRETPPDEKEDEKEIDGELEVETKSDKPFDFDNAISRLNNLKRRAEALKE